MTHLPLLTRVLRDPPAMAALDAPGWELLLRQAGAADLGATLALLAEEHGLLAALPARVQRRLSWSRTAWERLTQAVRFEVDQVQRALAGTGASSVSGGASASTPAVCRPSSTRW